MEIWQQRGPSGQKIKRAWLRHAADNPLTVARYQKDVEVSRLCIKTYSATQSLTEYITCVENVLTFVDNTRLITHQYYHHPWEAPLIIFFVVSVFYFFYLRSPAQLHFGVLLFLCALFICFTHFCPITIVSFLENLREFRNSINEGSQKSFACLK